MFNFQWELSLALWKDYLRRIEHSYNSNNFIVKGFNLWEK